MKKHIFIFLSVLGMLPALLPLFHPGFFQTDDGEWMIIRFSAFHQALVAGQFPVRFLDRLNFGYGYPVADFLYPGFMYLGEILKLLRFGFVDVIKITLGICLIESFIFSFFWLRSFFSKWDSFVGALVYLYTPYHLYDVYKRGSVGEALALAVVPFILWQLERQSIFWSALGLSLLILAHNTLAVLFLPIIVGYMVLKWHHKNYTKTLLYQYTRIVVFGIGIAAFFWIPALFDLQYTRFSDTKISDVTSYFAPFSLVGFSSIAIFLGSMCVFFKTRPWSRSHLNTFFLSFSVLTLLSIIFATEAGKFFWNFVPASFIQFPFRLLSVVLLSMAFLSAYMLDQLQSHKKIIVSVILFILLGFSALLYAKPVAYFNKGDSYYATNEATTTVQDEYMPVWVKQKPTEHFKNKVEIVEGKGKIENLVFNNKKISFDATMENSGKVMVNTVYFPGWEAKLDGKDSEIFYNNKKGVIEFFVHAGTNVVNVIFMETPARLLSDLISAVSVILLGVLYWRFRGHA